MLAFMQPFKRRFIVLIGNQWWMAQNLRVTHYSDGQKITSFLYQNDSLHSVMYGRYYSYSTATRNGVSNNGNIQGACPASWHIPSDSDWKRIR